MFPTTHWSVVVSAGRSGGSGSRRALATLCENYWFPLYAFVRRTGHSAEDARDLTQEFFARLLEKKYLAIADPQRGRFRCFLLASLKHFLANEWKRATARKRGGSQGAIPFDFQSAENRYGLHPVDELTPDRLYERRWAMTLLEQVLRQLRDEFDEAGKLNLFDHLKEFLTGQKGVRSYRQVGDELAMSEGAIKVAVHRLRRRYRDLLRAEIAQTVASPEELDDEVRHLFSALGSANR